jgi:membrane carboxypeptidase/penicillin-binding protein PbpC
MRHISGVTGAAPIWHDLMEELHKTIPVHNFVQPEGLVEKAICADNGLVPIERSNVQTFNVQLVNNSSFTIQNSQFPAPCPHTLTELFIAGTEPQRFDDWHQAIALDRRNGLRAGAGCPLEFVAFQPFTLYPAEAQAWAKKQGIPQPPEAYSPLCPRQAMEAGGWRMEDGQSTSAPLLPNSSALIFTSPDQGSTFRLVSNIPADKQKIRVSVRPTDGVLLRQVKLLINGQPLAEGPETLWQMSPGTYTFEAVGVDAAGHEVQSNPVTVKVVE